MYPQWATDMATAGYSDIESFSFDVMQLYSHDDWRGRIRASAGVGGTLTAEAVQKFDKELQSKLAQNYADDPLQVPHRCWAVIASPPVHQIL